MAGLIPMVPSSVSVTGTSASFSANGMISFTAMTALTVNGIFTPDYSIYHYLFVSDYATGNADIVRFQMTSSGTPDSGSVYSHQYVNGTGTTKQRARGTSQTNSRFAGIDDDGASSAWGYIFSPALAEGTAVYNQGTVFYANSYYVSNVCHVKTTTAYDGIYIYPAASNITGTLQFFALEE